MYRLILEGAGGAVGDITIVIDQVVDLDKGHVRGSVYDWMEYPGAATARALLQVITWAVADEVARDYMWQVIPEVMALVCNPTAQDILFIATQHLRTSFEEWPRTPLEWMALQRSRPSSSQVAEALEACGFPPGKDQTQYHWGFKSFDIYLSDGLAEVRVLPDDLHPGSCTELDQFLGSLEQAPRNWLEALIRKSRWRNLPGA